MQERVILGRHTDLQLWCRDGSYQVETQTCSSDAEKVTTAHNCKTHKTYKKCLSNVHLQIKSKFQCINIGIAYMCRSVNWPWWQYRCGDQFCRTLPTLTADTQLAQPQSTKTCFMGNMIIHQRLAPPSLSNSKLSHMGDSQHFPTHRSVGHSHKQWRWNWLPLSRFQLYCIGLFTGDPPNHLPSQRTHRATSDHRGPTEPSPITGDPPNHLQSQGIHPTILSLGTHPSISHHRGSTQPSPVTGDPPSHLQSQGGPTQPSPISSISCVMMDGSR